MEGSDILNVGECPTVVQDSEREIFSEACEFIWARALRAEGITDSTLKVTMTQASVGTPLTVVGLTCQHDTRALE